MSDPSAVSEPVSQETRAGKSRTVRSRGGSSASTNLAGEALWMAIFAIAVWIGFSIFLIAKANTNETEWTRIAWVFGSIQAIAFAAAGALFGTAVQEHHVNDAREQATSAKKDADQQRDAAAKGRVLAATLQAEAATVSADDARGIQRAAAAGATSAGSADELRQRYAKLSRSLFGDLI
jgi:uncharacterized integral membrane protein